MLQTTHAPLVALAGNPNTGKTTLFNRLTGGRGRVGNYPGVTVERLEGRTRLPGAGEVRVVDVPGAYSLSARSEEERLALRAVCGLGSLEPPDVVVCVVDATQLARNLYLALQLVELDVPVVVALNLVDAAEREGLRVDADALARELGVPVVPVVALRGRGLDALRGAIDRVLAEPAAGRPGWRWTPDDAALAADLEHVARALPDAWHGGADGRRRALALWALLSVDDDDELDVPDDLRRAVRERHAAAVAAAREIDEEVIRGRWRWIEERAERLCERGDAPPRATDRIDRVLLHPLFGFALFVALMAAVFQSLFSWADPAIGLVETGVGALGAALARALPDGLLRELLVDGVVEGVGAVLVFLPQILLLFLWVAVMEDSGYMARVAYLMDRVMRAVGLHGRAFVPMLSGYACAIPAILATRTMERHRDRLLTMMVVPLMTCSARLPVYGLLIAALYPPGRGGPLAQGLLLVAMYLFSTLVAIAAAGVLGRTVLRGPRVPLLLEMPPYRLPHLPTVLRATWDRSTTFVREAGTIILVCTIAMWGLLSFPRDAAPDAALERSRAAAEAAGDADMLASLDARAVSERVRSSYGGRVGRAIEPVIEPLGFDWRIGVGLLGAFAAREVFVSTMGVVWAVGEDADETSTALRDELRTATRTDGSRLFTPLVCLSLMVFFALACQCMSTVAVVKRETGGWRWPAFLFAYTGLLAYGASLLLYQGGRLLGLE